jgi:hypothetical protein
VTESWIAQARAVATGGAVPPGWQRVKAEPPPLLDADVVRGLIAPLVAAIAWSGAMFRETVVGTPLDPFATLLRLLALATTVRALLLGRELVARIKLWLAARRCVLVLGPGGLWARLPEGEVVAERRDIVAISTPSAFEQGGVSGFRTSPVYVVLASPLRTHVTLPPIFDVTPGALAERLMRWRGAMAPDPRPAFPPPAPLASRVYDDAARGIRDLGTLAIAHGAGWLRRAPWATVLLGVAIVEGFARAAPATRASVGIPTIAAALVALGLVPSVWVWLQWRDIAPRLGLAMVLTPAELLLRLRGGVLRVPWDRVGRLWIAARGRFSPLEGWAIHRALVIERRGDLPIRYDEAYLGVPVEVALGLCEAYASGAAQLASGVLGSVEKASDGADRPAEDGPSSGKILESASGNRQGEPNLPNDA